MEGRVRDTIACREQRETNAARRPRPKDTRDGHTDPGATEERKDGVGRRDRAEETHAYASGSAAARPVESSMSVKTKKTSSISKMDSAVGAGVLLLLANQDADVPMVISTISRSCRRRRLSSFFLLAALS